MKRITLSLVSTLVLALTTYAQQDPAAVNCSGAVPGCDLPNFFVSTDNSQNTVDFTTGSPSNPTTNPNVVPGNLGCLLSGETTSTFITINVVSNGVLEWSIEAPTTACLDWIMWPNTPTICADLPAGNQAPVACNWNGACGGFTGMSNPGNLPAGADPSDFENGLNVTQGQSFLLCLSNYSGISAPLDFSFFGTADVSCTASTPDQTICLGSSATVDIIVSSNLTSPTFTWLVTNGVSNTSSGSGVTVTPNVTTQYIVEIDAPALITPIRDTFMIYVVEPQEPNAGPDQEICLGEPINLNGTVSDAVNNTYQWSHNTTGISPTPSVFYAPNATSLNTVATVNQPGTYSFILLESNDICGDIRDTLLVDVQEMEISLTTQDASCYGYSDGEIHVQSSDAIEYSFDGGMTWQSDSFRVDFLAGTYNVCVRNAIGCETCQMANVSEPVEVQVFPSNDTTICEFDSAIIMATASGGVTFVYHWSQTSNTNANQAVTPSESTWYYVYAENEVGCISQLDSVEVSLHPSVPYPTYQVLNPEQCEPAVFTIVNTTNDSEYESVQWWIDGDYYFGNLDTINTPDLWAGMYDISMVLTTAETCSDSINFASALHVISQPTASFQHSPNPVKMFDTQVIFTSTSTLANEYQWYFEQAYPASSNEATVITSFPDGTTGNYDVVLIVTSELGCIDTLNYSLAVLPEVLIYAPTAFTPDGDEFNQTWKVFMEGIDIYDFTLRIFNRWGEVVWESHDLDVPWDGTYAGKKLPPDTYNWSITAKDMVNDARYEYNGHVSIIK